MLDGNSDFADFKTISDVLNFYNKYFTKFLAIELAETDQFPIEVMNEIRSVLTHIAKANNYEETDGLYVHEVCCAQKHLQRASLDVLKIAILSNAKKIDEAIDIFNNTYTIIPKEFYDKLYELKLERIEVMNGESSHPSLNNNYKLFNLYIGYSSIMNEFRKKYNIEYLKEMKRRNDLEIIRNKRNNTKNMIRNIIISAVISFIVGIASHATFEVQKTFIISIFKRIF